MFRAYRFKLAPTVEQSAKFEQVAGVCRLIYNLAWEQRRDWWRQFKAVTGRAITFPSQSRELTALREEFDWIAAVNRACQEQALSDLDTAFSNYFAGRASYPRPRKKGQDTTFRFKGCDSPLRKLNAKWSAVWLPKIGWVKFRDTRAIDGKVKATTIRKDANGWYVSFAIKADSAIQRIDGPAIGIDRGIANTLSFSTGERLSLPASLETIDRRHRAAQRVLARRKRGSKRRAKALRRCAVLSARRARIRRDWHHRAALSIARRFGTVVIEDLKVKNMSAAGKGKRGLNRSILNQGWSIFEAILAYKLEDRGGTLIKVDPAYTSQACSACGTIDRESRESQASFACQHCGFREHADVNAAINILRRGNTAHLRVEDGQWPADEARSINRSAAA